MSVQIKKNGIWEAVAGNATNTSGITESSALANIGTAANATQHDVNIAINDNALLSKADPVGGGQYFSGDLNDLTTPGVYSIVNSSNSPANYGTVVVYRGKSPFLTQEVTSATVTRKWVRTRSEYGQWHEWVEVTQLGGLSLYITTSDLGIKVGSIVTVETFVHSLWNFLKTLYPQSDYFNVNGMIKWSDVQAFYISNGNYTITSSGLKFDFFIRYSPWSNNEGTFLASTGEAFFVSCKYFDSLSNTQQDIFKFTLT